MLIIWDVYLIIGSAKATRIRSPVIEDGVWDSPVVTNVSRKGWVNLKHHSLRLYIKNFVFRNS